MSRVKRLLYRLRLPRDIANLVAGLHPQLKRKIKASFQELLSNPRSGKPLKDELDGFWSYRVGRHRIVYRLSENRFVDIYAIGPREEIYEEMLRRVGREQTK